MDKRVNNHKSSIFNYDANVLSFLIYLIIMIFNFVPFLNYFIFALPLIIYVIEKKSDFVRGHSLQAFVISFFSSIFSLLCLLVSYIAKPRCNATLSFCFGSSIIHKMFSMFGSIRWMFCGFIFVICLVLALRAYNYESYKLEYVDKFIDKIGKFLNKLLGVIPIGEEKEEITEIEEKEEPVIVPEIEEPIEHETVRERKKKKKIQRELEETMKLQALEEEKKEELKKETVRERKKKKKIQRELEETMRLQALEEEKKEELVVEEPVKKTTKKKTNNKNKVTKKSLMKASNKGNKNSSKKKSSKTKSKK